MGLEKCQTPMYSGTICNRPIVAGDKCICHLDDPTKDLNAFQHEVTLELRKDGPVSDLTGFVFPVGIKIRPRTPKSPVVFDRARFLGPIDFNKADFPRYVSFEKTQFLGKACFDECTFAQGVVFNDTIFEAEARFRKVKSNGPVDFLGCSFIGAVDYSHVEFKSDVRFYSVQFYKGVGFQNSKIGIDGSVLIIEEVQWKKSVDFSSATLHATIQMKNATFTGPVDYKDTTFEGEVSIREGSFAGGLSCTNATISKGMNISSTTVSMNADFTDLLIQGHVYFVGTQFRCPVSFTRCQVRSGGKLVLDGSGISKRVFQEQADFSFCGLDDSEALEFRHVDLSLTRFLGTDLTKVRFDSPDWPTRTDIVQRSLRKIASAKWRGEYGILHGRTCIYDEIALSEKDRNVSNDEINPSSRIKVLDLLAEAYRQLQMNYDSRYRYQEASGFYIGEQEMKRKMKGGIWQFLCTRFLYKLFSLYGQRWLRSFTWLLFVLFLTPAVLLNSGVWLDNPDCHRDGGCQVKYELCLTEGAPLPAIADYWEAVYLNLSLVSFSRSDMDDALRLGWQRALIALERLVAVILASFVIVALRRQHKRKSF